MIKSKLLLTIALACISYSLSSKCKDGSNCPGTQTCCLAARGVGCCPYTDAICCGDGQHCCPNGYVCGDNACYAPSQGTPALSLLLNNNQKAFLDTNSFITEENTDKTTSTTSNNYSEKNNAENSNSAMNKVETTVLDFDSNSGSQKSLKILTDEASKTTIETTSKGESFMKGSRIETILENLNTVNNSYLQKFFGCFKDMEPVVKDLITAYKQRKENTEKAMNIIKELINKLAVDGTQMTSDCKAVFALVGIAGII